jgi:hypothetical protein
MKTLNDALVESLSNEGYTGTLNDQLFAKLSDLTGERSTLPDMWMSYLTGLGYTTGTYNDRLMQYLGDKGYTGALPDRLYQAALDSALFNMNISVTATNVVLNNTSCVSGTGVLSVSVSGGVAPYTYLWTKLSGDGTIVSPSSASTDIAFTDVCPQDLLSGTYQIEVTDSNSEVITAEVSITAFNEAVLPLELTMSSTNGTAESATPVSINSTVSVSVSGGVTPYLYSWAKVSGDGTIVSGGTTDTATVGFTSVGPDDTPSGVFEVTVTDGQETVGTDTVSVSADNTFIVFTGTYSGTRFSATSQEGSPNAITWDGTYLWVAGPVTDAVYQYTSAGVYTGVNFSITDQTTNPVGITWNGTYFWVLGSNRIVFQYTSAGVYTGINFSVDLQDNSPQGITWDGTHLWVMGGLEDRAYKYTSAGVYTGTNFSVGSQDTIPRGITWDGTHFWVVGDTNDTVYQYTSAGVYTGTSFSVSSEMNAPRNIVWDGNAMWIASGTFNNSFIYKYI